MSKKLHEICIRRRSHVLNFLLKFEFFQQENITLKHGNIFRFYAWHSDIILCEIPIKKITNLFYEKEFVFCRDLQKFDYYKYNRSSKHRYCLPTYFAVLDFPIPSSPVTLIAPKYSACLIRSLLRIFSLEQHSKTKGIPKFP